MAGGDSDGDLQLFAAHQAAVIRHRRPVDSGTQEPMHYIYIFANYTSPDADILLDLINLPFPILAVHEAPQETIIKRQGNIFSSLFPPSYVSFTPSLQYSR